jgi:molybdate transport repressor ModE-like protein
LALDRRAQPDVRRAAGGAKGGGARVTAQGIATLEAYRRIEAVAEAALEKERKLFKPSVAARKKKAAAG